MKKTQKVFGGFLLAIKIISVIIALAIIIMIIDFFAGDNTWQTVATEIHKGCYIECFDNNAQSIFYYQDGDEKEKEEKIFLIFNTETEEKSFFDSQEKMIEFCKKENIYLLQWQKAHCNSFYQGKEESL